MRLEIGKRYITRDGKVTGQMEYHTREFRSWCTTLRLGEDDIPFSWEDINGCMFKHHETPYDLVSEYTEPNKEEKPMFKVGDKVRDSGGSAYTVLAIYGDRGWIGDDYDDYLCMLVDLQPASEPKYIRKSVPELMAEGWVFDDVGLTNPNVRGTFVYFSDLKYLGTDTPRPLASRYFPEIWKEVK